MLQTSLGCSGRYRELEIKLDLLLAGVEAKLSRRESERGWHTANRRYRLPSKMQQP
jgi:hypothetical protein